MGTSISSRSLCSAAVDYAPMAGQKAGRDVRPNGAPAQRFRSARGSKVNLGNAGVSAENGAGGESKIHLDSVRHAPSGADAPQQRQTGTGNQLSIEKGVSRSDKEGKPLDAVDAYAGQRLRYRSLWNGAETPRTASRGDSTRPDYRRRLAKRHSHPQRCRARKVAVLV